MLQRYVEKIAGTELSETEERIAFTDEGAIAGYAKEAVKKMQMAGIINGLATGGTYRFAPMEPATRAQAAAMIARLYQSLDGQGEIH